MRESHLLCSFLQRLSLQEAPRQQCQVDNTARGLKHDLRSQKLLHLALFICLQRSQASGKDIANFLDMEPIFGNYLRKYALLKEIYADHVYLI